MSDVSPTWVMTWQSSTYLFCCLSEICWTGKHLLMAFEHLQVNQACDMLIQSLRWVEIISDFSLQPWQTLQKFDVQCHEASVFADCWPFLYSGWGWASSGNSSIFDWSDIPHYKLENAWCQDTIQRRICLCKTCCGMQPEILHQMANLESRLQASLLWSFERCRQWLYSR